MRRIALIIAALSVLLVLYAGAMALAGHGQLSLGLVVVGTSTLVYLGTFAMLLSAVVMIAGTVAGDPALARDLKVVGGLGAAALVGVLLLLMARPSGGGSAPGTDEAVIEAFHKLYYATAPYETATFLGIRSQQYPVDNWTMQELIWELKPEVIVETGTASGGTALYYAMLLEQMGGDGVVVTTDLAMFDRAVEQFPVWKERVTYIPGNCISNEVVSQIKARAEGKKVLLTLDTNHKKEHVLKELEQYAPLVPVGSYIVVQDSHLSGHPNDHSDVPDEGPWEAIEEFLQTTDDFRIDRSWERHLISQNPKGYLERVADSSGG